MNRTGTTPRPRRRAPHRPPAEQVRGIGVWRGRADELCLMVLLMTLVAWAAR